MTHVLHRMNRRLDKTMKRRQTSRKMDAILRDPHLAKDVGLPHHRRQLGKPELW